MTTESTLLKQHVIDPEICIRCNTCEAICPVGAITHDSRNYVVKAEVCNLCMACISPCPTGSIDNWRMVPRLAAYSLDDQLGWDSLPAELSAEAGGLSGVVKRGVGYSAVGVAVCQLVVVVQTIVLGRLLGPAEVGVYTAGSVLTGFLLVFSQGTLAQALMHQLYEAVQGERRPIGHIRRQ